MKESNRTNCFRHDTRKINVAAAINLVFHNQLPLFNKIVAAADSGSFPAGVEKDYSGFYITDKTVASQ
jgi:hypothetical protein